AGDAGQARDGAQGLAEGAGNGGELFAAQRDASGRAFFVIALDDGGDAERRVLLELAVLVLLVRRVRVSFGRRGRLGAALFVALFFDRARDGDAITELDAGHDRLAVAGRGAEAHPARGLHHERVHVVAEGLVHLDLAHRAVAL